MKKQLLCITLTLLLIQGCADTSTSATSGSDRRSLGVQLDDQTIELKATKLIIDDPSLATGTRIVAISNNARVLLIGQVPSKEQKNRAENLVASIPGIKIIYNEIRLGAPISLSSQSTDSWLTSKVKIEIYNNINVPTGKIKVITENDEVFLVGLVTEKEAESAVDVARNVAGVRKVIKVFELVDTQ